MDRLSMQSSAAAMMMDPSDAMKNPETYITLGQMVDTWNHSLVLLTSAFMAAHWMERVFPEQDSSRPMFLEFIEAALEMTGFLLIASSVSELLNPFVYGYSEPLLLVLFTPFLCNHALAKLRRVRETLYSWM